MEPILSDQIRDAVISGEFRRAQALWEDFARHIGSELRAGRVSAQRLAEAGDLVVWAREMALAARAHAQDGLTSLIQGTRVARAYAIPPQRTYSSVRTTF